MKKKKTAKRKAKKIKKKSRKTVKKPVKKIHGPVMSHTIICTMKNYMETIVEKNLASQLSKRPDICRCERCRMDIMAMALNKLPSKYVVTDKGSIYARIEEMEFQINADVTREVFKAIEAVNKNKRHP